MSIFIFQVLYFRKKPFFGEFRSFFEWRLGEKWAKIGGFLVITFLFLKIFGRIRARFARQSKGHLAGSTYGTEFREEGQVSNSGGLKKYWP